MGCGQASKSCYSTNVHSRPLIGDKELSGVPRDSSVHGKVNTFVGILVCFAFIRKPHIWIGKNGALKNLCQAEES